MPFLHLKTILLLAKLGYAFEEKLLFCHHNFVKTSHCKFAKNELENIP